MLPLTGSLCLQLAPSLDDGTLRILGAMPYASWQPSFAMPRLVVCIGPVQEDMRYLEEARECADQRYDMADQRYDMAVQAYARETGKAAYSDEKHIAVHFAELLQKALTELEGLARQPETSLYLDQSSS